MLQDKKFPKEDITEDAIQNKRLEELYIKAKRIHEKNHITQWEYDCIRQVFVSDENATMGREMTIEDCLQFANPSDIKRIDSTLNVMRERRDESFSIELKYRSSGGFRYAILAGEPYTRDVNGNIIRYLGYHKDITDTVLINESIRESKLKTDMAMKKANMVMWEYSVEERMFTAFNDPLTNYDITAKYSPDEYIALLDPASVDETCQAVAFMDSQQIGEFSFKSKILLPGSSEWQYLTVHGSNSEVSEEDPTKAIKYIGFRVNNTELVRLSQGLIESNALIDSILTQSPSSIFIKDITNQWRYIIVNDLLCKLVNRTELQIVGHTDHEIFDQDIADKLHADDIIALGYDGVYAFIEDLVAIDGSVRSLCTTKRVITMDNGRQLLIGISSDITDTMEQQRALEEANKKSELVLNNANTGLIYIDNDFRIVWENSDSVNNNSYISKCKRGCICYQNIFGLDAPCQDCVILKAKKSLSAEKQTRTYTDGTVLDLFATPVIGDNNQINGYVCRIDDVTESNMQKLALEESKEKVEEANTLLQSIIRQIPFGLYIKDLSNEFRYVIMNDVLADIYRIDNKYAIGKTDYELFDKSVADVFHEESIITAAKSDGELTVIKNNINWHGQKCVYENSHTVITVANGRRLLVGVVVDITEKEHMLSELQVAKEHAEQSDKLKSAFLANMSHEIRTPLNAIVGFSELLIDAEDAAEREEYTNIISNNNDLLLRLIGDILDLSKIESGMIELRSEEFDMADICDEFYMTFKHKMTNPKIKFAINNPYSSCIINLDKNRLMQVGTNFLTNAIKYTVEGVIDMGYEYVDNGIKIYVEDTGIGIAEENHDKVFLRFEKFDSFAQGTGLGLSICKAIVEAQDGKIGFESELGKGSTFWAWFPCKADITRLNYSDGTKTEAIIDVFSCEQSSSTGNLNILIAEDNDSNCLLIEHILKDYNITRAKNGAEAVEMARTKQFNIILMDWKMPIMDGLTATRKIREFDAKTPIIAVTANAFDSNKLSIIEAGCNAFVAKPVKKQELFDIIAMFG